MNPDLPPRRPLPAPTPQERSALQVSLILRPFRAAPASDNGNVKYFVSASKNMVYPIA